MSVRQDLPLKQDPANRYLPWIIGFMTFLASLTISCGLSLNKISQSWTRELGSYLTIEVPTLMPDQTTSYAELEYKMHEIFQRFSQVGAPKLLSPEKLMPAIESTFSAEEMKALPKIYEARIDALSTHALSELKEQIHALSPHIHVDEHRQTKQTMYRISQAVQFISIGIVGLIVLGAISIIAFTAQTSLIIHRNVIEILYLIGASPHYIAKQFQSHAVSVGVQSTLINLCLGATLWGCARFFGHKILFISQVLDPRIFLPGFMITSLLITLFISLSARLTVKVALKSGL